MSLFQILQAIVLSYTALVALLMFASLGYEIKNSFNSAYGKAELFMHLNKFSRKYAVLNFFRFYSVLFIIAWLGLAIPLVDFFVGSNYLSTYDSLTGITNYLGTFRGQDFNFYFMTVFVSIVGVKGFWMVSQMADILGKDTLAVSESGRWGGRKDFR